MKRRTVADWRKAVLQTYKISDACRVLLLHIADNHMRADRKFSVPRKRLASEMGRAERRISDRIAEASRAGYLVTVGAGYRGHTAEYQGVWPDWQDEKAGYQGAPFIAGHTCVPQCSEGSRVDPGDSGTHGCPTTTRAEPSPRGSVCDVGSDDGTAGTPVGARAAGGEW